MIYPEDGCPVPIGWIIYVPTRNPVQVLDEEAYHDIPETETSYKRPNESSELF